MSKDLLINEEIRDKEVRVIDSNGEQLGIMPIKQALQLADQRQLDLVKVAPHAKPPVCKIMDYGKYKFQQSKKEKEAKKNQRVINVKEIRLSGSIEDHDLGVKARNAIKFLKSGDKVKVTIRFRGREMRHTDIGYGVMDRFTALIEEVGQVERKPKMEGRNMVMFISPKQE
ncbi:MAG TPA: translation initiation factor IF-3 [Clostridiales bacterium]|nr:translation initiation factor IF-3 [Clostridiales bacterium]